MSRLQKLFCIGAILLNAIVMLVSSATAKDDFSRLIQKPQQAIGFLPVDEAYHLDIEQINAQYIRLHWQIADGYYLYQHSFKIVLEDSSGIIGTTLKYPPSLEKEDDFFGKTSVYYNQVDLELLAEHTFGYTTRLSVTYQGCSDAGLCYPPTTKVFPLSDTLNDSNTTHKTPDERINASRLGEDNLSTGKGRVINDFENPNGPGKSLTLLTAVGFALLGGLILNTMPCVFPILSLKVLGFAADNDNAKKHHRRAWWYLVGVVLSFISIASVLILLQQAGQSVGWGFQLQSTNFVIALAYLFTVMGLSLSGLIHFGTKASLMNVGNTLANENSNRGSFFTGMLAVVVASPCTAPFMGSALGYALTQPPLIALLIFVALGVGMAFPMVFLSYCRPVRRILPKPGPWMESLKKLIAFPLYGSVVWLLWITGKQAGVDAMASALAGLVMLALGLFFYRGGILQRIIAASCLVIAVAMGAIIVEPKTASEITFRAGSVAWSPEALAKLREKGVPVFVDVTADWCITCLVNEKNVLFTKDIRKAFKESGVVYMVADWTNHNPSIDAFVKSHSYSGIPLYVMYPSNSRAPAFYLPQLLTRSVVHDALAKATQDR